ncbi:beta strand repeat-containing protein [Spiribacter insolitus]|uniref:Calcium-binding protein n=1 Tax=Spiribacter insolitus TaxID=3122417 RepID=A0ABV3T6E4_9GAMM
MQGADLNTPLTGTVTIDADGKASIAVDVAEDAKLAETETMTLTVAGQSADVTVNDTTPAPLNPDFTLTASADSVDEGQSVTFTLEDANQVANGNTYSYTISGVQAADVVGELSGTTTVGSDGKAVVTVDIAEDALVAETETLTLEVADQSSSVTVNDVPPEAQTFTLTTSGAVITPSGNEGVTPSDSNPTVADDTFEATAATLNDSEIDGAGGRDTLELIRVSGDSRATSISNVEVFNIAAPDNDNGTAGDEQTINAIGVTGVEQIWSVGGPGSDDLTVTNIGDQATIGLRGLHDGITYTANFDTTLTDSFNDSLDVALEGISSRTSSVAAADNVTLDVGGVGDGDGFETLNINSGGDTFNQLAAITSDGEARTLDIGGTQSLNVINDLEASVATIDASDNNATINLQFGNVNTGAGAGLTYVGSTGFDALDANGGGDTDLDTTGDSVDIRTGENRDVVQFGENVTNIAANASLNVQLGSGNDSLDLDAALSTVAVGANVTVDGGDGDGDELQVTAADDTFDADLADAGITGFEALTVDSASNTGDNVNLAKMDAGLSEVTVNSLADAHSLTLDNVISQAIELADSRGGDSGFGDLTINLADASGGADLVNLTVTNTESIAGGVGVMTVNAIDVSTDVETLNLELSTVFDDNGDEVAVDAITSGANLILTGDADSTLGGGTGLTNTNIDASLATGDLTLNLGSADQTISGSTRATVFDFAGNLDDNDTVTGNSGNDTIAATIGTGVDIAPTLTGVETADLEIDGGTFDASNATGLNTIQLDAVGEATLDSLADGTAVQQDGDGDVTLDPINLNAVEGSAASVTYSNAGAAGVALTNGNLSTTEIGTLTIDADDGEDVGGGSPLSFADLVADENLTTLQLNTAAESADNLTVADIDASGLTDLTVNAGQGAVSLANGISTTDVSALETILLSGTSGNITVGNIGDDGVTEAAALSDLSIDASGGSDVIVGDVNATGAASLSIDVDLVGDFGSSSIGTVDANSVGPIAVDLGDGGTDFTLGNVTAESGNIGNVTVNAAKEFDGGDLVASAAVGGSIGDIDVTLTGEPGAASGIGSVTANATGSVGNITVTNRSDQGFTLGAVTAATLGNIAITTAGESAGNDVTLTDLSGVTGDVGTLNVTADSDVTFTTGLSGAASVGAITVDVTDTNTVDFDTVGAAGATLSGATITGAGDFVMTTGAVDTVGSINAGGASGAVTVTLSNMTTNGMVYTGSSGVDTFTGTGAADLVNANGGNDVITAQGGNDIVNGGEGNDTLDGGLGGDTLNGNAGDDVIIGGQGADAVDGGAGTDTFSAVGMTVEEVEGSAADSIGAVINLSDSALTAGAINTATGNFISGLNAANEVASGQATYLFDTLEAAPNVIDTLTSIENLIGSAGTDYLVGSSGDNVISGGTGADTIDGGNGSDTVSYADALVAADDSPLTAGDTGISLDLSAADPTVTVGDTNAGADEVSNVENIIGTGGDDTLTGDGEANALTGGGGNDTITGGAGNDQLSGGDGADTFVLETTQSLNGEDTIATGDLTLGAGNDVIDFDFGTGDNIAQTALRGDGSLFEVLANGGAIGTNTGLVVSSADVSDAIAAEDEAEAFTGEAADDIIYLLTSTDYDSAEGDVSLYSVTYAGEGDAALELLASANGVDLSGIGAANLADFDAPV